MSDNIAFLNEWIKKNIPQIDGVGVGSLSTFIDGSVSISEKKHSAKITISFPLEEIMAEPYDARKLLNGDLKIVPVLLFLEVDKLKNT